MCKKIRRYIVILRVAKQQHKQQRKMRDFGAYLTPSAKFCRYIKLFLGWCIEYMQQQCLMCKKIRRYIVILRVAKQQHTQQRKMRDFGAYLTPSAKFCRYIKLFLGWCIEIYATTMLNVQKNKAVHCYFTCSKATAHIAAQNAGFWGIFDTQR